jgi:transposase
MTADCPVCGKRCASIEDTYTRRIRDLDLGLKQCFLVFDERKIRCRVAIVALRSGTSWTSTASTPSGSRTR